MRITDIPTVSHLGYMVFRVKVLGHCASLVCVSGLSFGAFGLRGSSFETVSSKHPTISSLLIDTPGIED